MTTILIKDTLRASVEAASGGAQTVLYTTKGQPTFMNVVKKFDLSDVLPDMVGTHPAFIINGVEKSEIFIGTYESVIRNGELLSLPNQKIEANNYNAYFAASVANGPGHHMMTNAEWAALALRTWKDGTVPQGNSYYGRSVADATQYGRRVDGLDAAAGITTGIPLILTGSGPVSFRHNGKYNGISDLIGNSKTMLQGARLVYGELQIIPNNDSAATNISTNEATLWKAIDARTGDLITPNGLGSTQYAVRFSNTSTTDAYTLIIGSALRNYTQASAAFPVSEAAIKLLRKLAMLPPVAGDSAGSDVASSGTSSADAIIMRGGHYAEGVGTGVFAYRLVEDRTLMSSFISSRSAYYQP